MIRILYAKTVELPGVDEMRAALPEAWLAAFDAAHRTARRESLGGVWMLWRSGVGGELRYDGNGRPFVVCKEVNDLNISHTKNAVFCALASGEHERVGIDAEEWKRPTGDMVKIAKRFFSPDEVGELLSANDREATFLRLWTRREAYAKFCGDGLAKHLGKEISGEGCCFASGKIDGVCVTVCTDAPVPDTVFAPSFVRFFGKDA